MQLLMRSLLRRPRLGLSDRKISFGDLTISSATSSKCFALSAAQAYSGNRPGVEIRPFVNVRNEWNAEVPEIGLILLRLLSLDYICADRRR